MSPHCTVRVGRFGPRFGRKGSAALAAERNRKASNGRTNVMGCERKGDTRYQRFGAASLRSQVHSSKRLVRTGLETTAALRSGTLRLMDQRLQQ